MPLRKYLAPVTALVLSLVIGFAAFAMYGPWLKEQFKIDHCREAGNRWDFATQQCEPPKKAGNVR